MPSPAPLTLRETYRLYKEGGRNGAFGRQDMIGKLVDEIEALQGRIGAVDEAAVAELDNRVESLETVIGNALREAGGYEPINADGAPPKASSKPRKHRAAAAAETA